MPEMATVCQETDGMPPSMFGSRGSQGVGPPHNYYNHCGYPTPPTHGQYGPDGYGAFQPTQDQTPHHNMHHQHPQQHHQQGWGYSMGMMGNGRAGHGSLGDEWGQGYLLPGTSTPTQNPYNYQYRNPTSHTPLDYGSPLPNGPDNDAHGLEGSPSPHTPSPGEPPTTGMGPNNQGAKSLRPPYEWMKPSVALPQAGHVSLFPGKTRTKDKYRVVYSDHQRLELEKEFHFSKYITIRRKAEIAGQLGLSERQVKIWFQNRRAKERKQNKKRDDLHMQHTNGSNNINPQEPHQVAQSSAHDDHPHHFMPKAEIEEESPCKLELTCHSTTLTPGSCLPSSHATPTPMSLHPNLHSQPRMSVASSVMGRSHAHPAMGRYHESVHRSVMSPPCTEELAFRMSATADSSGNSMNLSGSSDSGGISSH